MAVRVIATSTVGVEDVKDVPDRWKMTRKIWLTAGVVETDLQRTDGDYREHSGG